MAVKAIVLGAGKGTRMQSELAKVLHPVADRPMLLWVLDAVAAAGSVETVVVVGHQADEVRDVLPEGVGAVLQAEQLGTGHAASIGLTGLDVGLDDEIIVIPGDMPLVRGETMRDLVDLHRQTGAAATLLTVELDEPRAYGRVIRTDGAVTAIVEVKDATPEQLAVAEVNTSVYVFTGQWLAGALERISTENTQGEYYLTDVVEILVGDGHPIGALLAAPEEGLGVNSIDQLAGVASVLESRQSQTS
ncbi:MAG: NTP transferase domain-containing protein [Acidimicrobiia bacterium]|nr:NTP transferase domain-containing protein [Acidimicrobiia bacterium]MDX2468542.1 NTP transferase domain-containing protein [Acidimicrobiia bacterium]